ncbi:hypothetical protein ACVWZT_004517 [Pseudomonas sp. TE21394]
MSDASVSSATSGPACSAEAVEGTPVKKRSADPSGD